MRLLKNCARQRGWLLSLILLLNACSSGESDIGDASSDIFISSADVSAISDSLGIATLNFEVPNGARSFQLVAFAGTAINLESLQSEDGQVLLTARDHHSDAFNVQTSPATLNYPVFGSELPGRRFVAKFRLGDGSRRNNPVAAADLKATILTKMDQDISNGVVRVNMVMVGSAADDLDARESFESALQVTRQIFARAGLEIDVQWYFFPGPQVLPDPQGGDVYYEDLSSRTRQNAVNVVIANSVSSSARRNYQIGLASSIPGPSIPSRKSAVALGIKERRGNDGRFDVNARESQGIHNDEERLAAEELARLIGQYLGLYNIVDIRGDDVIASDPLSDSAGCVTEFDCRYATETRNNFMFPYPLRKFNNSREFYARDAVTAQQAEVMHRAVMVE